MHARRIPPLFAHLVLVAVVAGQTLYPPYPDWESADTQVSTGAALVDLNLNGWLDLVVANGNDMARQRIAVYYNRGDGTFPILPDWQSADLVYNGHLDVADVNGDGWPDIAVATLGEFNATGPIARVYLNNQGVLSSLPDWSADVIGNAFGVAFGDMNNDGRPDLAVATGWAYSPQKSYRNYVYLNVGGTLEATASWQSDDIYHYQGACWVDADGDGWLDLAFAAARTASRVYRNLGGMLETTASWQVLDVPSQDAIMVTAGDVNGDGYPELFLADNNQLAGGSGRFRQYDGLPTGMFHTTASWSFYEGYCSAVALADVNGDGTLDLMTGGWWRPTRLFLNTGTGFEPTPSWQSARTSVIEKIVFGDINKNGLRPVTTRLTPGTPGQRLFHLPERPIQRLVAVVADGVPLAPWQYTLNHEHGWITVGVDVTTELRLDYTVSTRLDMAVTNWDNNVGNFVYYNRKIVLGDVNCDGKVDFADINPFVDLLTGGYHQKFPECDGETYGDINGDGRVDFADINPFVELLLNP